VVVEGDHAVLYYFTHPHWDGSELGSSDASAARLSAVFSAPLRVVDDRLVCIRDALNAETSPDRVIRAV